MLSTMMKQIQKPTQLGSYPPEDVTFLLKDLSLFNLETGTEDKEEAIQNGRHYSEMLPIEYKPSKEYIQLFHIMLRDNARQVASAVATVAELIFREHGSKTVLASLARAGTPIGILIKRYLKMVHRVDLPHYSISIIRGKGIDENALIYMLKQHPEHEIQFVDGWTGKGAIRKVLIQSVVEFNQQYKTSLSHDLAVLADPGECVNTFGTRKDFVIPSACLNSTVSGLLSRTILRNDLIENHEFHGVKFYKDWGKEDLSQLFVETICAYFYSVTEESSRLAIGYLDRPDQRSDTWKGIKDIQTIQKEFNIRDINLIKPGVGETTRVLLRRVPWKIIVNDKENTDLKHITVLARERGVEIVVNSKLAYACCGIIKPLHV
ncbi:cysteine protease StiP family protein [Paenibacillus peoriae]|uniref:Cysteine protease StiP family protein n=1 Tax=Paenibacillus peoriae TaxID=59893 RepID=A0A7H0Y2C4_9BACL|nr:cysteine protease StiP family protein [Paenibacillus peoriae]QNR65232.1 cysteine protease StiP family protein [Paenibacillus peoriae]